MRILYIHDQKRIRTGAHQFNNMLVTELRRRGNFVDTVYPKENLNLLSPTLKGINSILFFYSLIQKRREIYKYDLIQGTTYTTLAFVGSGVPVVSHFGSTTLGFLRSVPSLRNLGLENKELAKIYRELKGSGVIESVHPSTKSIKDIGDVEVYVAKKSDVVVASSEGVRRELVGRGVPPERVVVIHNALEDFWFGTKSAQPKPLADVIYLGRMGDDAFTIKLKGINRLVYLCKKHPMLRKVIIGMSGKKTLEYQKIFARIPNTFPYFNVRKKLIPKILRHHFGDIYVNPSRYEGFCLSLVETMSQGLVPLTFPVGVAPEIMQNGVNGYMVNSIEEMIEKVSFLKRRPALRGKMAQEAMRTSRMFRPKNIVPQYIGLYAKLHNENTYGGLMSFLDNLKE